MPLDTERSKVAHLLRRAGFGATEAELDEYTALGFSGAVERLLAFELVDDSPVDQTLASLPLDLAKIEDAKFWWLTRMLYTRRPLQEKMVLFWHTHFATANSKVGNPGLMLGQLTLFRTLGLGNFETLLQRVTRDPAMLIWLDNRLNVKRAPNENFAREVMELFTIGIGNYSEDDVKAAARAFTGYTLNGQTKEFVLRPNAHDAEPKTFMGETRNWDADDILAWLVRHPATASRLTTKLFEFFAYDSPAPATVDRLTATWTNSNFDIRAVVRDILLGPEFLSAQAFHGQIKQPVEYLVGTIKSLNVQNLGRDATQVLRRMGQDLLNPPDVSGWPGGPAWINATTLFERFNFANRLASGRVPAQPYFTDIPGLIRGKSLQTPEAIVDYLVALLVDGDATPAARASLVAFMGDPATFSPTDAVLDRQVRGVAHLAMSLPSYQLA